MPAPPFENDPLELVESVSGHIITPIASLKIAKVLPTRPLVLEYQLLQRCPMLPIFQDIFVLLGVVEDVKTEFDWITRPAVVINQGFVVSLLRFFLVWRLPIAKNWGGRARPFDLAVKDGHVSKR